MSAFRVGSKGGQSIAATLGFMWRTNKLDLSAQLYLHIVKRKVYSCFPANCTANDLT